MPPIDPVRIAPIDQRVSGRKRPIASPATVPAPRYVRIMVHVVIPYASNRVEARMTVSARTYRENKVAIARPHVRPQRRLRARFCEMLIDGAVAGPPNGSRLSCGALSAAAALVIELAQRLICAQAHPFPTCGGPPASR